MSKNGEIKGDFTGIVNTEKVLCEITDGLQIVISRETASTILLSNEEVYKGLREKFVITIELIPEEMTVYENGAKVKFEDKHKYYERMQARGGIE